jgi:Mg/Co/Ni transporter MgtE
MERRFWGETELIKHVTEFYKKLFGPSPITSLRMDGVICNQLSEEDRQNLIKPFSLEEIKEIVDDLKHDKAAGPDGFPAEFYQKFGTASNMI